MDARAFSANAFGPHDLSLSAASSFFCAASSCLVFSFMLSAVWPPMLNLKSASSSSLPSVGTLFSAIPGARVPVTFSLSSASRRFRISALARSSSSGSIGRCSFFFAWPAATSAHAKRRNSLAIATLRLPKVCN